MRIKILKLNWGNAKLNANDRSKNGKTVRGEKSPNAKLKEKQVKEIRSNKDKTLQGLADKYKVSKKLILLVKQNKIWTHIK